MTSNLGSSHFAKESIGFAGTSSQKSSRNVAVEEALVNHFRPEFLNRIDETIIFDSLSQKELLEIAEIVTSKFIQRVKDLGINMKITKSGLNWLVDNGFDKSYGARPLKRVVQRSLENEFAKKLLSGEFNEGDSVIVTANKNNLIIKKEK